MSITQGDDGRGQPRSHKKGKPGVGAQSVQRTDVEEVKEMTMAESVQWASTKETTMWFSALGKEVNVEKARFGHNVLLQPGRHR
jgi:hypothetical protein